MRNLFNPNKPSIIVVSVRGGVVQQIHSNLPVSIIVEDWDGQEGECPDRCDVVPAPLDYRQEDELIAQFDLPEVALDGLTPEEIDRLIDALHERNRQIAVAWCIDDVISVRPDLSDDQAWEVLKYAKRKHDAEYGISWTTLEMVARNLIGAAPKSDEAEEA